MVRSMALIHITTNKRTVYEAMHQAITYLVTHQISWHVHNYNTAVKVNPGGQAYDTVPFDHGGISDTNNSFRHYFDIILTLQ